MSNRMTRSIPAALALSLGTLMAGCATDGAPEERGLESVHQPIVSRSNFTLDLFTGSGGLSAAEQRRLAGWFEAMDLRFGDRVAIDDPLNSAATRDAIGEVAKNHGLLLAEGAPVTPGYVDPGKVRVVISRSTAKVEGCPDWDDMLAANVANHTKSGFGCAINGNLADMVANPEDLIRGSRGTGETTVMSSTKAIDAYRKAPTTGAQGLTKTDTKKD